MTPPWWLMLCAAAGLALFGSVFARRERGRATIIAAVVATQAVLHICFEYVTMRAAADMKFDSVLMRLLCTTTARPTAAEMAAGRRSLAAQGMTPATFMHTMPLLSWSMAVMAAAHLAAALVLGLWLAKGERALWRYARRVGAVARAVIAGWNPPAVIAHVTTFLDATPPVWRPLAAPRVGRAPPRAGFVSLAWPLWSAPSDAS